MGHETYLTAYALIMLMALVLFILAINKNKKTYENIFEWYVFVCMCFCLIGLIIMGIYFTIF